MARITIIQGHRIPGGRARDAPARRAGGIAMRILAHRGAHAGARENSLEAFAAARALGVDGIETDLRVDRDGVAYLFHDSHLPGGVAVAGLRLDELRAAAGFAVPRLDEALATCPDMLWNLELKEEAAVAPLLAMLRRVKAEVFISSFLHEAVLACVAGANVEGGLLIAHRPLCPEAVFQGADDPRVTTLIWHAAWADAAGLRRVAATGRKNWLYGFATLAAQQDIAPEWVDAVITDFPEVKTLGRTTGIEPVTTRTTNWRSTN